MVRPKNICILGSTGSIGQNSLEVISSFPEEFKVLYLTANKNIGLLTKQIERYKPHGVVVNDESSAAILKSSYNGEIRIFAGPQELEKVAEMDEIDIVINALVGFSGLKPTLGAVRKGKTIALANNETLVIAGEIITKLVEKHNAKLLPIDSEHSAILQCLAGENPENISRLLLTASGGPFLNLNKKYFDGIKVSDALKHPKWKMGNKITIDSATLMNKGLEVIEAHWLFKLPPEKIEVLIHPQSIVHSMVEFVDGSIKAQLGMPDMKIPIQYALTYPGRVKSNFERIDFVRLQKMTFLKPDFDKFECLGLAYEALRNGGTIPTVLNAANEIAVELFLTGKIKFSQIPILIRRAMEAHTIKRSPSIEDIFDTDLKTKIFLKNYPDYLK